MHGRIYIRLVCFFLLIWGLLPTVGWGQVSLERTADRSSRLRFIGELVEQHIEEQKLVGAVTWVFQNGEVIHHQAHGQRDREAAAPMKRDSIFRIHSFTKAISTTAVMMLWEEGKFQLDDPVAKYLPEFANVQVYDGEGNRAPERSLTVRDLLRHTSGVIYGNKYGNELEKLYDEANLRDIGMSLEEFTRRIAKLPLAFSPGERWQYGMSIDLLGRLVEVWSGQTFEDFVRQRILVPLEMTDTDFFVPLEKLDRLATLYQLDKEKRLQPYPGGDPTQPDYVSVASPTYCSPGGGLYSTADDYGKFLRMILAGGELHERRLLKPKTTTMMTSNQLPANISEIGFGKEIRDGFKFGFGFNVIMAKSQWDPDARIGEFGWGGAASCHYWVYPPKELIVITLESTKPYGRGLEQALKGKIYEALD